MSNGNLLAMAAVIIIAAVGSANLVSAASNQEKATTGSFLVAKKVHDAVVGKLWYGRVRLCAEVWTQCRSKSASLRFSGDKKLQVTFSDNKGPKKLPAKIDENGRIHFTTPQGSPVILTLQPDGNELSGGFSTSGANFNIDGMMDFTLVD